MSRTLIFIMLIAMLSAPIACGAFDIGNETVVADEDYDIESPVEARAMIGKLRIEYTIDEFVERARQSDEVAVELFLMAGMDLDVKDKNGVTALEAAKTADHEEIVELLAEWVEEWEEEEE